MPFDLEQEAYVDFRSILKERTHSIVAWVGSGMSAQAGVPTWSVLRDSLAKLAREKADALEAEARTQLLGQIGAAAEAEDYWTSLAILKEALGKTTWEAAIRSRLAPSAAAKTPTASKKRCESTRPSC